MFDRFAGIRLPHLFRQIISARLTRALFVGVIAITVQTIVFETLGVLLQIVSASTAVVIGAETGILTNFYLNNRFSFNDRRHKITVLSRLLRFHLVVSGSVFLQWLFVYIAESSFESLLAVHAAYVLGIVLGFVWNYTLYHLVVWKKESSPSAIAP